MPLPKETRISHIHLRVRSIERMLGFYHRLLGFKEVERSGLTVTLSSTGGIPVQIILTESNSAPPRLLRSTGLFHTAIRFPNRIELAKTLTRIIDNGYPFEGAADHLVSEAVYLVDPEGNGVELYCDRPAASWSWSHGEVAMATHSLDVKGLLSEAVGLQWTGLHPSTDIGHIHLRVSSLETFEEFYSRTLGFDVTSRSYPGALFLSAGSYHHHIGGNIWSGKNIPRPPANSLGLIAFGISIPNAPAKTLIDADGIRVEINGDRIQP